MSWIEDNTNTPLTEEELADVRSYAHAQIAARSRRAALSALIFVLGCACLYPFLAGHTLHRYWESFGKYLLIALTGVFVAVVYAAASAWSAYQALRDVEKNAYQ